MSGPVATVGTKINHVLHTDLAHVQIGKRTQGFLLALLIGLLLNVSTSAQQRDCYGEYMAAMRQAWDLLYREAQALSNMSYWYRTFNPIAVVNEVGTSIEYYARTQSAYYQFLACSAIPIK